MKTKAGFIPFIEEDHIHYERFKVGNNQKDTLYVPALTVEQLSLVTEKVKENTQSILKKYKVAQIVDVIDQATHLLLDRSSIYRKEAEKWLPKITGYDSKMIRLSLTTYLKSFRKKELLKFLVEDLNNWNILDDFQPRVKGGFSKAVGPNLMTHIWAGNVPGVPLWSFVSSLLVKAGSIGKVSSAEPYFAGVFARAIAEIDPELAKCFAIVWWRGGDEEKENVIGEMSEVVVGYGNNDSLHSLRNRLPITTRFVTYGHKFSFGIISKYSLHAEKTSQTARDCAYDVMRFDQQGCYSPHVFFVQHDGKTKPNEFAQMVANELAQLEVRYPRRTLHMEEAASLSKWKQTEELKSFSNENHGVYSDTFGKWAVIYEDQQHTLMTPLNRTVKIIPFHTIEDVQMQLKPLEKYVQSVGVACSPEELFHWATALAHVGATRFSSVGKMTSLEPGWHHDGRFNLLDLVNVVDIDDSLERYSEQFAAYID